MWCQRHLHSHRRQRSKPGCCVRWVGMPAGISYLGPSITCVHVRFHSLKKLSRVTCVFVSRYSSDWVTELAICKNYKCPLWGPIPFAKDYHQSLPLPLEWSHLVCGHFAESTVLNLFNRVHHGQHLVCPAEITTKTEVVVTGSQTTGTGTSKPVLLIAIVTLSLTSTKGMRNG